MSSQDISSRWAKALFNLTQPQEEGFSSRLEEVQLDLEILENPVLIKILSNPGLDLPVKEGILKRIFKGESDILRRFLSLLIKKDRIEYLDEITDTFKRLTRRHLGTVEAKLYTAVTMPEKLKETLALNMTRDLNTETHLKAEKDPRLLGGAVVLVENRILDGSLKGKLDRLKDKLLQL